MNALIPSLASAHTIDPEVAEIVESAISRLQRGEEIEALIAEHAEHAAMLRELLPAVIIMVGLGEARPAGTDFPSRGIIGHAGTESRRLGEFQIIRELGRGGMGVVYEAEQLSMSRYVALKVLPFAALAHENSLQRFRNEVRAAASLDHPNIVSVYSVGEERGVHYYAMQLIRGQSLAELIAERRSEDGRGEKEPNQPAVTIDDTQDTTPVAALSTLPEADGHDYFKLIARLGQQAAIGLQHAHDLGVVHRDIKPSNLLLDRQGKLYVTDFGLARIEADASLTMTGDIIGTLRYMAPEQAFAKRVVIGHRADIYSLGATLYELLTLQPAFGETDRAELLKHIVFEEPRPLRKLDHRIPAELETIVLKAMAKLPEERYQRSGDLAADLRAFVDNRPIKAKPPTMLQCVAKWSRRHRSLVSGFLGLAVLSILVIGGSVGWVVRDSQIRQVAIENNIMATLDEVSRLYGEDNLIDASATLLRARSLLSTGYVNPRVSNLVEGWRRDLETVHALELCRIEKSTMFQDDLWDLWATPDSYRTVFANHGFNQITVSAKEITSRIKSSPIKPHLVAAIDDWATVADEREQSVLRALAREVDNEPWKNQLRNAIAEGDVTKLKRLINSDERFVKSRVTVATVTNLLVKNGETEYAIELLRRAHRKYPTDFWINYVLGIQLQNRAPLEAIGFLIVAKSQRPKSGTTCNALGNAYYLSQQYENAEAEFRKAVQLDPSRVWHHSNLAQTLARLHRLSEGEKVCRETLEAFPDDPLAHYRLCEVKLALGQSSDARKACQDAVRFVSESTGPYVRRGLALILAASELEGLRNGKKAVELAIRACEQTDYRQSETLIVLAAAYAELGNFELAIKWAEEAVSVTESDLYREAISQQLEKFRSHEPLRLSFRLTRFHAGHR